ncbi:hypothetical protein ACU4GH_12495 [Bradyrhizobium betae]
MRPNTLAEAVSRIHAGAPQDTTLAEFVDTFDLAGSSEAQYETIKDEPMLTQDDRLDAPGRCDRRISGQASVVSAGCRPGSAIHARRLAEPWFTTSSPSDAMREYLTFASPAEFASRNIFTEERPLRRARGPLTAKV